MAARGSKIPEAVHQRLAALRGVVDKLPAGFVPLRTRFAKATTRSPDDEILLVLIGPSEAIVKRMKATTPVDSVALHLRLEGAEIALQTLATPWAHDDAPSLTVDERAILDEKGFTVELPPDVLDALTLSRIETSLLDQDSLDLAQAARDLGVSAGRLRQRLSSSERTLFGFKEGRGWRIPRFQFAKRGKLVRGIDKVLPHISENAHPLAVRKWFTTPHQDLVLGDEETPVAPLDWLSAGLPPEPVAELAEEI